MRRTAHVLFHQQHSGRTLDVETAAIETHALADNREDRVAFLAPCKVHDPRRMMTRSGAPDRVDHRIFLLERVSASDLELRGVCLGQFFTLSLERGGPHIFGRRVDEVANQANRFRFGDCIVDRTHVFRQQDPWTDRTFGLLVAIEDILSGLPAVHGRAGFTLSAAIRASGQCFRQFGHAPARKLRRVRDSADRKPAVTIGHDSDLVAAALELLRFERGALGGGQLLHPLGKAVAVDEMQRNRVLPAVGLDKRFIVGHIRIASELSGLR